MQEKVLPTSLRWADLCVIGERAPSRWHTTLFFALKQKSTRLIPCFLNFFFSAYSSLFRLVWHGPRDSGASGRQVIKHIMSYPNRGSRRALHVVSLILNWSCKNFFVCWNSICFVNFSFGQKKKRPMLHESNIWYLVVYLKNAVLRSMPESTGINGNLLFPFFFPQPHKQKR